MSEVFGQQDVATTDSEYNMLAFVFWSLMQKVQTAALVQVISCTNNGAVSPIGTVTVQPLVNQMTGNRQAVPHGQLYNCLYARLAAGENAIIMDPQAGDIGMMTFCSRDISGVRENAAQANPGSFRMFDWADGIYWGGVPLNVMPNQRMQFAAGGITITSPTKITLQAPTVEIDASTEFTVNTADIAMTSTGPATIDASGALAAQGSSATLQATTGAALVEGATTATLEATGTATVQGASVDLAGPITQTGGGTPTASLGAVTAASVATSAGHNLDTHVHGGVQTGGGDTGPPV